MLVRTILLLGVALLTATGCAWLPRKAAPVLIGPPSPEALAALRALNQINASLQSIKGLGTVRIRRNEHTQSFRVAWLGQLPNKLRVEILGPYGRPVASLADDGRQLTVLSYADEAFERLDSSQAGLERLLAVRIRSDEVLALLAGRTVPLSYATLALVPGSAGDVRLRLLDSNGALRQQIDLLAANGAPRQVEVFEEKQRLRYQAGLLDVRQQDRYRLPRHLSLSTANGVAVDLEIEQVWTDVRVDAARFVLEPPAQAADARSTRGDMGR